MNEALYLSDVFGMSVSVVDLETALQFAIENSGKPASLIVTPNLDHLQRFHKDSRFRDIYSRAKLVIPDGMPVVWLARLLDNKRLTRITGVDFVSACIDVAASKDIEIVLIGGRPEVTLEAKQNLVRRYSSKLKITALSPTVEDLAELSFRNQLLETLSSPEPKIVALCLGSPKQEYFFEEVFENSGTVGVFIGAGATVDFLAGTKSRSPVLLQNLGLEWLHRLALEPRRLFTRYALNSMHLVKLVFRAVFHRLRSRREYK